MAHWLMKSEPGSYSWDQLQRDGATEWDGVRNPAARLHLKAMKAGDEAFFYHSGDERQVAAINEDARPAHGEGGYVDGDPICQCQDPDGLHAKVGRVTMQAPAKALAEVILDYTDSTARRVRFSLVRTAAGWRIADVASGDE